MTSTSMEAVRRSSSRPSWAAGVIIAAIESVLLWNDRGRDRRHLASLDDRMLRDIGLSRADVEREYRKSFWQA
jgi:uncharacterized protein YjiS (DUF1127 family)